jgi:hypothetical protein
MVRWPAEDGGVSELLLVSKAQIERHYLTIRRPCRLEGRSRKNLMTGRAPCRATWRWSAGRSFLIHLSSRLSNRATCMGCQCRLPAGVGMPRPSSAAAMSFRLVMPAARSSAITGARSAAARLARAVRALSALLGARWPVWRPVGIAAVCHCSINGSETLPPARCRFNSRKKRSWKHQSRGRSVSTAAGGPSPPSVYRGRNSNRGPPQVLGRFLMAHFLAHLY